MSDHSPSPGRRGGIDSEIDVRRVLEITAWLAAILLGAGIIGYFLYKGLGSSSARAEAKPSPLVEASAPVEPPAPRLQLHPETDLKTLRASTGERLSSWGWLDRAAGVAHMPIEEAIQRLAVPEPSAAPPLSPSLSPPPSPSPSDTAAAPAAPAAHATGSGH